MDAELLPHHGQLGYSAEETSGGDSHHQYPSVLMYPAGRRARLPRFSQAAKRKEGERKKEFSVKLGNTMLY